MDESPHFTENMIGHTLLYFMKSRDFYIWYMYADIDETAGATLECYRVYGLWYKLINKFHIQCILPFRNLNMGRFL